MWVLVMEAVFAFFLLVFIVWWTMYSGRKPNRPRQKKSLPQQPKGPADDTK
jgi:cytoskeletal protein RodZ